MSTNFQSRASRLSELFEGEKAVPDLSSLAENRALPDTVREHLVRVYSLLAVSVLAAACGALLHTFVPLGGTLTSLLAVGTMVWVATSAPEGSAAEPKRTAALLAFSFLQGLSVGPLVNIALVAADPSVIVAAFAGTSLVFACFTASALMAQKNAYLALGGFLSSAVSLMIFVQFLNIFFRSAAVFSLQLYGGLVVFCLFVLYDTQLIVGRAEAGDRDHVWHALLLFVDFVAVFVRVLIILLKNSEKKSESRSNRRR